MSTVIAKDGARVVAKTVGEWPKLTQGYHWHDTAPLGESPVWTETLGTLETSNQRPTLFGYDEAEFMARQYKKAKS